MPRLLFLALLFYAGTAAAQDRNPQIDYAGFQELAGRVSALRQERLLSWNEFEAAARSPGTLVLDARSADAYAAGHVRGAINLPLTDFTAESLAMVIGDRNRQILIYCNNNFTNDQLPVPRKAAELALNIQTFINLVGYGYQNVRELNELVDFNDPRTGWVRGRSPNGDAA